jgi:hypothetical protein
LFKSQNAYLIYPGEGRKVDGEFYDSEENGQCGLSLIPFYDDGHLTSIGVAKFIRNIVESTNLKID